MLVKFSSVCFLVTAGIVISQAAPDIRITSTNPTIPKNGGRVSWGGKNNLLAIDSTNSAGYYDVYTVHPDGSNLVCLTCGSTSLPAFNKGDPEWHPSNNYLAIAVQWQAVTPADQNFRVYRPGDGVGNDLYIADAAGKNYWAVTAQAPGILHPRFSHDGTKLTWVQRKTQNFWNLMLGDFTVSSGVPVVSNIRSLPPCATDVFCETGGFSADDSIIFFTGILNGQPMNGLDIYSYTLSTGVTKQLTDTPNRWDEFPYSFPNSNRIIWMSGVETGAAGLQTDYWSMNNDGSDKVQLTFYNYRTAPSWFTGTGVAVARMAWSPDGTQMAAHTIPNGISVSEAGTVIILSVEPAAPTLSGASFARPPLATDSIVSTFYPNLATATTPATSTTLPTDLSGTTVTVTDAQGTVKSAPLFFVSPGQLNWQVPSGLAAGPATVAYTNSQGVSVRATIDIEPVAPGIFTANSSGSGAPIGYLALYPAGAATSTSTQYLFTCPSAGTCTVPTLNMGGASDLAYLTLFATGLRHSTSVVANVGGQSLPVSFSGPQGAFSGLDQVNVLLPHSLAGTGLTTVELISNGFASNAVQVQF